MTTRTSTLRSRARAAALLLACLLLPVGAGADRDLGGWTLSGQAELGGRIVSGDGQGSAKYEEYRDQDAGLFGAGDLLFESPEQQYYFRARFHDAGERDERYEIETGRWGQYRLSLDYSELPHVFSNQASSFFDTGTSNRLPFNGLHPEALDYRLRTGGGALLYRPNRDGWEDWEFETRYQLQDRQGSQAFAIGFGNPGDNFVNVARPKDERIHEVKTSARWAREGWSFEAGYTGSFFQNDLERLEIDNFPGAGGEPASSTFGLAPEGQISLAPDNAAHTFRLSGAATLPIDFPARLAATLAYSQRRQDADFLCHTINAAIDPRPGLRSGSCPYRSSSPVAGSFDLPADSLDGEVDTLLGNVVLTARPSSKLRLKARYRIYDYDNDTDELEFPDHVENDTFAITDTRLSIANEHRRQNASLDASYRLARGLTLRSGYEWEQWSRSDDRSVRRTNEHGGKLALDYRAARWLQLRAGYELAVRRGTSYDAFAHLDETHLPGDLSAQDRDNLIFAGLTKYDQADRISDRVDLLAQIAAREDLSLTLTGSYRKADYDSSDYGLQDDESYGGGLEASYQPFPWLDLSAWYAYEEITYRQRSRWRPRNLAGPFVDDPVNDWKSRSEEVVHTLGVRADLELLPDRLDLALGYGFEHAKGKTRSSGVPGCTTIAIFPPNPAATPAACVTDSAADQGSASDFPDLRDVLQSAEALLSFHAREDLTLQLGYRYEKFDITDFKTDDIGVFGPPRPGETDIFLGEAIRDYKAHIVMGNLIYRF